MGQVLVNGQYKQAVNPLDRGLLYGDGFFTTVRVTNGNPQLWLRHVERLQKTAQRLGFAPPDISELEQDLALLQRNHPQSDYALRVTCTRGTGGRGYAVPANACITRIVSQHPIPAHYQNWSVEGVRLGISQQQLGHNPMLAGLKTLNRLEQVLLKQELAEHGAGYDDLVVTDDTGMLCETTAANLFWYDNGTWYTPDLARAGVSGVVRQWLIEQNPVRTGEFLPEHLYRAQHIFICNALMGIIPVRSVAEQTFSIAGDIARQLSVRLSEQ